MRSPLLLLLLLLLHTGLFAQQPYPYPVRYINLTMERQAVKMAYMDAPADNPNGKSVLLFHGKNFNGYYWKDVVRFLNDEGYRVIVPDQVGWGKSDKPNIHYSFHQMAGCNKALLDSLHISSVILIAHSMGGMLATRFVLMYPGKVEKLILEDPIGLEDYRTFVPYFPLGDQYKSELSQNYESYKKYMQSYFPIWKPEYEELVRQEAVALAAPNFKDIAWANALTYEMIYEQPVCYEFSRIRTPTLVIVGQADRTIVGKDKVPKDEVMKHGQYPILGQKIHSEIPGSLLVELPGVGHIPHIQDFGSFRHVVSDFLKN
jgi:pimeloyl-ACP methyl ester carboxylesterase